MKEHDPVSFQANRKTGSMAFNPIHARRDKPHESSPGKAIELKAFAKVNLCLSVKYPPVDGYHQLDSVFQELALHDTLKFWSEPLWTQKNVAHTHSGSAVALECDVEGLSVEDNLIFRALDAAESACGVLVSAPGSTFSVAVEKHIHINFKIRHLQKILCLK